VQCGHQADLLKAAYSLFASHLTAEQIAARLWWADCKQEKEKEKDGKKKKET
jgi:hypothetical protein